MANLNINGKTINIDVEPDTPLLWAIRENVGLTGTKYGCGIAQCGACTVHIDGVATRSCGVAVSEAEGKQITTIEGLAQRLSAAQGAAGLDRQRCAAMRLLPERHDHGGRSTSEGEAEADRRRHRRGHHQYLPLRHLPAGARSDSRRHERLEEAGMNKHVSPRMNRRAFVIGTAAIGTRPCARPRPSLRRTGDRPRRRRLARSQRLGRDPARRYGGDPHRALGDGPGHAHRSRPARRRRARMRLVEGHDRISRRPARTSRASAPGAISRPAAAAASAPRRNMSARAARPRARC